MASTHDQYAKEYDQQIKNQDCFIADILFGLSFEYIRRGESILDVGIGTGLSSRLFSSAGLHVFGIDSAAEMLNVCQKKHIAEELVEYDLLTLPWPYQKEKFHHVVCCGVFHFIGDLDKIFQEFSRIHKPGGILAFTVMKNNNEQQNQAAYDQRIEGDFTIYSHKDHYIYALMQNNHYRKEKEIVCNVGQSQFKGIIARKVKA